MNILITGANSGFGKLIVADLVKAGHKIVGSMRDIDGRNAAAKEEFGAMGVDVVEIDVTDEDSVSAGVAAATDKLGSIDVLINNAGVGAHGLQESFTAADFQRLFDINVFGVQRMVRAVLPDMRGRGDGLILNISSLLGRVTLPFYGPYNASKWALEAMTENYRVELSQFGVDVTLVEPGGFPTRFFDNLLKPSTQDREAGYGEMAAAPKAALEGFEEFLSANPQQNPQLVAEAVTGVIATRPGERPLRTEVDRIGMGEPIKAYNEHLGQVTTGIFTNLGIEGLLQLRTGETEAA
ncbi:MAG: SDR family oxidoreductase [Pseudomonadota bacterium]